MSACLFMPVCVFLWLMKHIWQAQVQGSWISRRLCLAFSFTTLFVTRHLTPGPWSCVSSPVSLSHLTIGETVFIDDCIQLYVGSGYPNPEPSTLFVERQSLYPSLSLLDLVFSPGSFFLLNTDYNHPEDSTEEWG